MTFLEIMPILLEGHEVKRQSWHRSQSMWLNKQGRLIIDTISSTLYRDDIEATDWEVIE